MIPLYGLTLTSKVAVPTSNFGELRSDGDRPLTRGGQIVGVELVVPRPGDEGLTLERPDVVRRERQLERDATGDVDRVAGRVEYVQVD